MVKGPSLYNPWRNPQYALDRRNVVLKLMLDHQMIGDELYELLSKRPLGVQAKGQISRKYPAFTPNGRLLNISYNSSPIIW